MKRHFEFVSGSSCKFWEVSVSDCSVTFCFCRIGTTGQQQMKEFPDAAAGKRQADKQIAEKIRKGYLETTPAWQCFD